MNPLLRISQLFVPSPQTFIKGVERGGSALTLNKGEAAINEIITHKHNLDFLIVVQTGKAPILFLSPFRRPELFLAAVSRFVNQYLTPVRCNLQRIGIHAR